MRYKQLVEKRSNPELNPRIDINQELLRLNQQNNDDMYVSFTSVKKLGINPNNIYNTPTGIYSYPLDYVASIIENKGSIKSLPYASERPYAWVLKLNGNKLDISSYKNGEVDSKKLQEYAKFKGIIFTNEYIHTGIQLFSDVQYIAKKLSKNENSTKTLIGAIMSKVLGYDFCVDHGSGIIHENEPYQCVIYNPRCIVAKQLLNNGFSQTEIKINITKTQIYTGDYYDSDVIDVNILNTPVTVGYSSGGDGGVSISTRELRVSISFQTTISGKCSNITGSYSFFVNDTKYEEKVDIKKAMSVEDIVKPIIEKSKLVQGIKFLNKNGSVITTPEYTYFSYYGTITDTYIEFSVYAESSSYPVRYLIARQPLSTHFSYAMIYGVDYDLNNAIDNRKVTNISDLTNLLVNAEARLKEKELDGEVEDDNDFDDFINGN